MVKNTINGKQFTVIWHVDDLKLSHVDKELVDEMIDWMKSLYRNDMRISRGKKHDYLGMNPEFSVRPGCSNYGRLPKRGTL